MANIKISQLTPKGANLESTDLLEISEFDGSGYVTRSITGQEIIDAAAGGDFVPYIGATQDLDLGNEDLLVNEIFLYDGVNNNYGSIHFTDGNFHIENASGLPMFVVEDGYVQLHKSSFIQSNLYTTLLGSTRDHYLPDASGTIALTSDVATKQDTLVSGTNIKTLNGASLLGSGGLSVQPTLVSGTNIKTINGSSVLGSGNLTISGGVSSVTATYPMYSSGGANPDLGMFQNDGTVDGYITSSDYMFFANKQEALVSGTNIKSINGNSIVGSGDLVVGGLSGVHALLPLTSGGAIAIQVNGTGITTVGTINNRLYAIPFIPARTFTTSNFYLNVTVLGTGVSGRILIYSDLNGKPNAKLYESASLDCSTIGTKTATTSFTFSAGVTYWICTYFNGNATVSAYSLAGLMNIAAAGNTLTSSYFVSATFPSAPSPFGNPNSASTNLPAVFITAV
jgi:hypothetical protein